MSIEKMERDGKILALILRKEVEPEGVNFFTTEDNPLQLGILKHKAGTEVKPHIHKSSSKVINSIQEVLHVDYGKVKVNFYDDRANTVGVLS